MRPRSAAKHSDMLTAPTMPMASSALPSSSHSQPLDHQRAQPLEQVGHRVQPGHRVEPAGQLARGTYDDVRNRNGKNSRKLEFTAAGLPVLSAIA